MMVGKSQLSLISSATLGCHESGRTAGKKIIFLSKISDFFAGALSIELRNGSPLLTRFSKWCKLFCCLKLDENNPNRPLRPKEE